MPGGRGTGVDAIGGGAVGALRHVEHGAAPLEAHLRRVDNVLDEVYGVRVVISYREEVPVVALWAFSSMMEFRAA
jgi:hypothetical protein